jgi:hypothetical protein
MLEHRDPLPSPEFGRRAATPTAPPYSGKPTLRPSSSSFNWPPSPPSTPPCCRTPPPSPKLTGASLPSKKRHRAAPSTTSSVTDPLGEPHHHPSCSVTSPHHPRAHAADCAAREPPASPGRPHHRACGHCAVTTLGERLAHRLAWASWPLCRWVSPTVMSLRLESWPSTVHQFSDFQFMFIISKNLYNLQKCIENTILLRKIQDKFMYTP